MIVIGVRLNHPNYTLGSALYAGMERLGCNLHTFTFIMKTLCEGQFLESKGGAYRLGPKSPVKTSEESFTE
jgi:hypothetical protein